MLRRSPMETLTVYHHLPFIQSKPRQMPLPSFSPCFSLTNRFSTVTRARVSIGAPPLGFDYRMEFMEKSKSAVAEAHPELMDLVEEGTLALVDNRRFGPVPEWRREFVEPEAIWLVGTAHGSLKSAADVQRVVRALRPDNVVVELCRSRAGIMYASKDAEDAPLLKSNMFSLSGAEFFSAVSRSINLGGQSALALRLLLAVLSSKIPLGENRSFGDEFRAARKSSEELGAQIVLGDRPIEITLERAWNSLVWSEKLKLIISLFRGITSFSLDISQSEIKGIEMEGGPFQLYEQLSKSHPSLLQPLIYERDTYLAWSLKRSKAVNNSKRVVGVIGNGHMNGVIYALISDQGNLRFCDLAGSKAGRGSNHGWMISVLKSFVRDTILGFVLWALYEHFKDTLTFTGSF